MRASELLEDPHRAETIPIDDIPQALGEIERIRSILRARLLLVARATVEVVRETVVEAAPDPPRADENDGFFTADDVAPMLAMKRFSVYELVRQKQIPAIRLGRRIRIPKAAFKRWMEERQLEGDE